MVELYYKMKTLGSKIKLLCVCKIQSFDYFNIYCVAETFNTIKIVVHSIVFIMAHIILKQLGQEREFSWV